MGNYVYYLWNNNKNDNVVCDELKKKCETCDNMIDDEDFFCDDCYQDVIFDMCRDAPEPMFSNSTSFI